MRLLYLVTRAERGGAQVHVLDLVRGLRQRCEIEVASGEDGFLLEEARQLGIRCHVVPELVHAMRPTQDARALWRVTGLIRQFRPALVHTHTSKAGVVGRLAARMAGVPSVYTAHTWCFAEGTKKHWKMAGLPLERLAARLSSGVIAVSEANRQLALKENVDRADKVITIHNGVADTQERSDQSSHPPLLTMVARFAPQKEQALLLRTLSRVANPFRLQFVGDGPTRVAAEQLSKDLGLAGRVDFVGDSDDVERKLGQSSVFVLATRWEGFPLSILEAMRAQLPVVATDVGGVREAVVDGVNGFLVRSGDSEQLGERLARLLVNRELRLSMGRASREAYLQRFTLSRMLQDTFDCYARILERTDCNLLSHLPQTPGTYALRDTATPSQTGSTRAQSAPLH